MLWFAFLRKHRNSEWVYKHEGGLGNLGPYVHVRLKDQVSNSFLEEGTPESLRPGKVLGQPCGGVCDTTDSC